MSAAPFPSLAYDLNKARNFSAEGVCMYVRRPVRTGRVRFLREWDHGTGNADTATHNWCSVMCKWLVKGKKWQG